jgi:hypothetical protein
MNRYRVKVKTPGYRFAYCGIFCNSMAAIENGFERFGLNAIVSVFCLNQS